MEIFYGLLASQSWADILKLVKVKQATLKNNRIEWEQISSLLESEFVKYVQNEKDVLVSTLCTEYIKLQISGYIKVSPQGLEKIELIGFNASLAQSESDAKNFSRLCYHSEPVITYKQNPIKQKNKSSGEIEQKKSKFARTDWLQPLFKSEQEKLFNQALKDVFPNFFIYPNVAVSNLFDFEEIKQHLTPDERDYFFKSIIDFVIYDPIDYTPKFFFEVDSIYHDTAEATIKDNKKNNFFDVAGLKLHRIRLQTDSLTNKHDFIREIRKMTMQNEYGAHK